MTLNKNLAILIILALYSPEVRAIEYNDPASSYRLDSIVAVAGHIKDFLTGEAIGNATILYEELPFGGYKGISKSSINDGFYGFRTFGHQSYRIEIIAERYQQLTDTIYPLTEGKNGCLIRDYKLRLMPSEEVIPLENLIFDLGKSEIRPESFDELDNLVKLMKINPEMIIQLEGHTDFKGGRTKNLKLSEDRVRVIKDYMIHGGIMPDRILTKAFGGTEPLSWETSEEAARLNRRVEVRIINR
jgi:outer membrane protein OmpA-like peptidoglycan-associated protein